jgi:hypothetical protein
LWPQGEIRTNVDHSFGDVNAAVMDAGIRRWREWLNLCRTIAVCEQRQIGSRTLRFAQSDRHR